MWNKVIGLVALFLTVLAQAGDGEPWAAPQYLVGLSEIAEQQGLVYDLETLGGTDLNALRATIYSGDKLVLGFEVVLDRGAPNPSLRKTFAGVTLFQLRSDLPEKAAELLVKLSQQAGPIKDFTWEREECEKLIAGHLNTPGTYIVLGAKPAIEPWFSPHQFFLFTVGNFQFNLGTDFSDPYSDTLSTVVDGVRVARVGESEGYKEVATLRTVGESVIINISPTFPQIGPQNLPPTMLEFLLRSARLYGFNREKLRFEVKGGSYGPHFPLQSSCAAVLAQLTR